ncbi:universal stress protein [uncultured Microbacterium sp.]|uniref:universal stress protein n=1 Tax=uncultured Microbacterium sp. TaxID=191216 RepID=UPI0026200C9A|nr:universal stress protein [uncultured Microbacterium sp.]
MAEKIIVGVSGAPVSDRAVDWAVARGRARGQSVELLAVVGGVVGAVGEASVLERAMAAAQGMLDEQAARAGGGTATRVLAGNPVAHLIDASKDAALLVLGSDYRGPESGPARGAHGIRIAAGAHCPVVVVPDIDVDDRAGVVIGLDGSAVSERALAFAAGEADRLGEKLIAVSVWTPLTAPRNALAVYPEMYLANMQAVTEEMQGLALAGLASEYPDLVIERVVERGYPSHIINAHAARARLIVLGSHGRGALARFLLGSISQEVLERLATVTAVVR